MNALVRAEFGTFSEADVLRQFANALRNRGIVVPSQIIGDGTFHRADVDAPNGKGDASYILHLNGIAAGSICNWQDGIGWQSWKADIGRPFTDAERAALRQKAEADQAVRDREDAKRREEKKAEALKLWNGTNIGATPDHLYLKRKAVHPRKIKLYRGPLMLAGMACDGALMIPLLDDKREVAALQFISGDGVKRYFGPTGGRFFPIGKPAADQPTLICEGVATGLTLYHSTRYPVVCAMDAGNLGKVGATISRLYPGVRLIYCADDDSGTEGNPGITKATEAARATGGLVTLPDFGPDRPPKATDFNDLAAHRGTGAVVEAVRAAREPAPMPEAQPVTQNACKPDSVGFVSAGEWPQPQSLPDGLPPVKPFDPDLMPDKLRPWVADIGDRLQCPLDFVAVAVMVSLGSVIGRRIGIRPQEKTDWTEYANLWGCIVGRPSLMKSPAMERGLDPLRALGHRAVKAYEAERLTYDAKMTAHKVRRDLANEEMRKRLKGNVLADVRDLQIEEPEEPQMRRYFTNDSSYEKLGDLHRANPNGLLVFRDELVSLLKNLDREDNAGARGFYLTGWSGNSPYVFDRMTREGAALDAICLSVLGSTQPGKIADYIRAAVRGGSGDDGLMQRFGLLVWPDTNSDWKDIDRWPDSGASREAFDVFARMSELEPLAIGAQQDADRETGEVRGQPYLRLDSAALGIFREWREEWERRFRGGSELPALESHFTKYRKLVPALALISHLADTTGGDVGSVAMLRALSWAEYLEPHARRAYASLDAPEQTAAKAIIDRIRKGELPSEFKARDIYRKGWAHLTDPDLVHNALRLLADFDWLAVREVSARETGGGPARIYIANPRGLK